MCSSTGKSGDKIFNDLVVQPVACSVGWLFSLVVIHWVGGSAGYSLIVRALGNSVGWKVNTFISESIK